MEHKKQGLERSVAPILSLKKRSQGHLLQQLSTMPAGLSQALTQDLTASAIPLRLRVAAQGLGYYSAIARKLSSLGQVPPATLFPLLSQHLTVPPCLSDGESSQFLIPLTPLPDQGLGWLWDYRQMTQWLRELTPTLRALPGSFSQTITAPVPWGFVQYAQGRGAAMGRLLPSLENPPLAKEDPLQLPDPLRSLFKIFVSGLDDWETRPSVPLVNRALNLSQGILIFEAQAWPYRQPTTPAALISFQNVLLANCQTLLGIWLTQAGMTGESQGSG